MRIKNPQKHCSIFAREEKVNIISRNLSKEHLKHLHTSKVTHSVCVCMCTLPMLNTTDTNMCKILLPLMNLWFIEEVENIT